MFEITNMRAITSEKAPYLKASFSAKFKMLELNRMFIKDGKNGMYLAEPTDKPYENKDGKTTYPKFFHLEPDLKKQIEAKAIHAYHQLKPVEDQQSAQGSYSKNDEIPF